MVRSEGHRDCQSIPTDVATTRTIDLRQALPDRAARDSRPQGAGDRRAALHLPAARDRGSARRAPQRRRREHIRRLRGRRRVHERRPLPSADSRGGARAGRALHPHRLHDHPVRELRRPGGAPDRADPDLGRGARRLLQLRGRGDRECGQVRPRLHGAAGRDRLRGWLPGRTLLALSLTSKTHRTRRASARSRRSLPGCVHDPDALEFAFKAHVAAGGRGRDRVRARAGRKAGHRPLQVLEGMRRVCDDHGIVLVAERGADRLLPHRNTFAIALRGRARPDGDRQVDRCGTTALRVIGRAEIMDAPGDRAVAESTSATRWPSPPRTPSST